MHLVRSGKVMAGCLRVARETVRRQKRGVRAAVVTALGLLVCGPVADAALFVPAGTTNFTVGVQLDSPAPATNCASTNYLRLGRSTYVQGIGPGTNCVIPGDVEYYRAEMNAGSGSCVLDFPGLGNYSLFLQPLSNNTVFWTTNVTTFAASIVTAPYYVYDCTAGVENANYTWLPIDLGHQYLGGEFHPPVLTGSIEVVVGSRKFNESSGVERDENSWRLDCAYLAAAGITPAEIMSNQYARVRWTIDGRVAEGQKLLAVPDFELSLTVHDLCLGTRWASRNDFSVSGRCYSEPGFHNNSRSFDVTLGGAVENTTFATPLSWMYCEWWWMSYWRPGDIAYFTAVAQTPGPATARCELDGVRPCGDSGRTFGVFEVGKLTGESGSNSVWTAGDDVQCPTNTLVCSVDDNGEVSVRATLDWLNPALYTECLRWRVVDGAGRRVLASGNFATSHVANISWPVAVSSLTGSCKLQTWFDGDATDAVPEEGEAVRTIHLQTAFLGKMSVTDPHSGLSASASAYELPEGGGTNAVDQVLMSGMQTNGYACIQIVQERVPTNIFPEYCRWAVIRHDASLIAPENALVAAGGNFRDNPPTNVIWFAGTGAWHEVVTWLDADLNGVMDAEEPARRVILGVVNIQDLTVYDLRTYPNSATSSTADDARTSTNTLCASLQRLESGRYSACVYLPRGGGLPVWWNFQHNGVEYGPYYYQPGSCKPYGRILHEMLNPDGSPAAGWTNYFDSTIFSSLEYPTNREFILRYWYEWDQYGSAFTSNHPHRTLYVSFMDCRVAMDGDRDGSVDFDNPEDKRLRFWINNDQDVTIAPELKYPQDNLNPEYIPAITPDSDDTIIQSERDLEDFVRLHVKLNSIMDKLRAGKLQLGLKWKNPSMGIPSVRLFNAYESDGGWGYIRSHVIAQAQTSGVYRVAIPDAEGRQILEPRVGVADFVFSQAFWESMPAGRDKLYLLLEGVTEGKGEVAPVILDAMGNLLFECEGVSLELRNIERLYARAHSTPTEAEFPYPHAQWPGPAAFPFQLTQTGGVVIPQEALNYGAGFDEGQELPFERAYDETNKCIVFVHGIALTVPEVRCYTSSFYKRLWWQGFKGRLMAFRWSTPTENSAWTFDNGEFHSWTTGRGLLNYVNNIKTQQMPGATVSMMAHSLGNACAGSALRQGLVVDNYVMMEAAVALSAYYATPIPANSWSPRLTKVQSGTSPDDVSDQGFRSFLSPIRANITGNWVNYYNEGDFWLQTGRFSSLLAGLDCNWVRNQEGKPDNLNLLYSYDQALVKGTRCRNGSISYSRPVEDLHEALAYIAQSQTRAVGAAEAVADPRPPGSEPSVNLQSFGFARERTDHSGQFQRNIQQMYSDSSGIPYPKSLYEQLMTDLDAKPSVWPK